MTSIQPPLPKPQRPSTSQQVAGIKRKFHSEPSLHEASSSPEDTSLCLVCRQKVPIYTCPRCSAKTCSLACVKAHKQPKESLQGDGCSGERNKAAYIPLNEYGYSTLMNDYVFLEDLGRRTGEWGRDLPAKSASSTKGKGKAGPVVSSGRKRDLLIEKLDTVYDITLEELPAGMHRRKTNQSVWDTKTKTGYITVELRVHPSSEDEKPFTLLSHRNDIKTPLLQFIRARIPDPFSENSKRKGKERVPDWAGQLVHDQTETFICVVAGEVAALDMESGKTLGQLLKGCTVVEYPTFEVWDRTSWEEKVRQQIARSSQIPAIMPRKRRKLNKAAMAGMLGGYGSSSEEEEADKEETALAAILAEYEGSDFEEQDSTSIALEANKDLSEDDVDWGESDHEPTTAP